MAANVQLNDVNDVPVGTSTNPLAVTLTNGGGNTSINSTVTGWLASDGSSTITTGGTAQNLFAGATPTHGYAIYNPDATNDLWVSESTTAAANAVGSIRVSSNGGAYETPPNYKPFHAISIVGGVTGQKFTARQW